MSKLTQAITATQHPETRRWDIEPLPRLLDIQARVNPPSIAGYEVYRVDLSARLGASVFCRSAADIDDAKQNMRSAIVEEVFGEFKTPLLKLRVAIDQRDYDLAKSLHGHIMREMFNVER